MLKQQLVKYTEFNIWANRKISDLIVLAGDEKTDLGQNSSFASIRQTWLHIYDAEFIWTSRLNKTEYNDWPPSKHFKGNTKEFVQVFLNASEKFSECIRSLPEEKLQQLLTYKTIAGKEFTNVIADVIMHVVNHSTYHRGQIITMLRGAGFTEVTATDFIAYCREA